MDDHTRTRDSIPQHPQPPSYSPYASFYNTVNHPTKHPRSWRSTVTLSAILNYPELPLHFGKAPGAARAYLKRLNRLQQRLGAPAALIAYDAVRLKRKLNQQRLKESMARHVKDACMKREWKRAMKTKILLQSFQRIHVVGKKEKYRRRRAKRALLAPSKDALNTEKAVDSDSFTGRIVIQDHLAAITQALSEHCKDVYRRKEPGRHSFHVDAAMSKKHDLTGVGVTFKAHRQDWTSSWAAKGY
ncbi:MAG: hypothetical protein Q9221_006239 [Calogaya cf. arnoldii]